MEYVFKSSVIFNSIEILVIILVCNYTYDGSLAA